MSTQVTSRLVKKEKKKLLRQTIFFSALTLFLAVLFLFVILPGFITIIDRYLSSSNPFIEETSLPPQTPRIAAPPNATNSATLVIAGYGESQSEITLLLNALPDAQSTADDEGNFTLSAKLQEGENTIELFAQNQAGTRSNPTRSYVVLLDTEDPALELQDLADGAEFVGVSQQSLLVKGTTEPRARIFLNGRMVLADSEGAFTHRYQMSEGENELSFEVVDVAGNKTQQTLTVSFRL